MSLFSPTIIDVSELIWDIVRTVKKQEVEEIQRDGSVSFYRDILKISYKDTNKIHVLKSFVDSLKKCVVTEILLSVSTETAVAWCNGIEKTFGQLCCVYIQDRNKAIAYLETYDDIAKVKHQFMVKQGKEKVTHKETTDDNSALGESKTALKVNRETLRQTFCTQSNLANSDFNWPTNARNVECFSTPEAIEVYVYEANILKLQVDCIVNSANVSLQHGDGVAKEIADAAGYELTNDGIQYIKKYGNIKVGKTCTTTAGQLPYACVIHAIGPRWYDYTPHALSDVQRCENDLYSAIYECFVVAERRGLKTIALPSISSAIFGVPEEICVYQYARATKDYSCKNATNPNRLTEIHFVNINPKMVKMIQDMFRIMIRDGKDADYTSNKYVTSQNDKKTLSKPQRTEMPALLTHSMKGQTVAEQTQCESKLGKDKHYVKCFRINEGIKVYVYKADILNLGVDCIVNAANGTLMHDGGLARIIADAAGTDLIKEGNIHIQQYGNIPVGGVCSTTAGRLPYKCVIHAVGPRWCVYRPHTPALIRQCEKHLSSAIINSFLHAEKRNLNSIALPALSSRSYVVPVERCVQQYVDSTMYYSKNRIFKQKKLFEIHFVDIDSGIVKKIQDGFKIALLTDDTITTNKGQLMKPQRFAAMQGTYRTITTSPPTATVDQTAAMKNDFKDDCVNVFLLYGQGAKYKKLYVCTKGILKTKASAIVNTVDVNGIGNSCIAKELGRIKPITSELKQRKSEIKKKISSKQPPRNGDIQLTDGTQSGFRYILHVLYTNKDRQTATERRTKYIREIYHKILQTADGVENITSIVIPLLGTDTTKSKNVSANLFLDVYQAFWNSGITVYVFVPTSTAKNQMLSMCQRRMKQFECCTEEITDIKLRTTKPNQTWSGETRQSKTEVKTMFDRSIAHEGASERSLEQHFEIIPTHVKPHGHSNDTCADGKEIKVQFADLSNAKARAKYETTENDTDYKLRPTKTNQTWNWETRQSKTEVKTVFDRSIAHEGASERSLEQHFEIIPTHVKPHGYSNDECVNEKEIKVQFADLSNANARAKDETTENVTDYKLRPTKTNQTWSGETRQSKTEVKTVFDRSIAHEGASERNLEQHFEIIPTHVKPHGHSNDTCADEKEIKVQFADLSNANGRAKEETTENVTDYKLRPTKRNQTWSGETRQSKTEVKTMFDRSIAHEGASERSLEQHFEIIPTHVKPHGHSNDTCVNEKEKKVQFADLSNANARTKDEITENVIDYKLRPTKTNQTWSGETCRSKTEVKTMFDRSIAHEGASERSLEQHFEIIPTHVKPHGHSNDTCVNEKEIKVQFADLSNAKARAKDETTENVTDYKLRTTKTNQTWSGETRQSKTEVKTMFDRSIAHEGASERSLEQHFEIIPTHVKPNGHSNDTCVNEKEIKVQFADLSNAKARAKDEITENVTDYKLRTTKTNQTWSGETRQSKTEVKTMFDRSIAHEGASERSLEQHFEVIPTHVKPHGHSNDTCVNEKEIKVQFADLSNAKARAKDEITENVTDYKLQTTKTNQTWSGEIRQSKTEVKTMFDRSIAHEGALERSLEQHFEIIPTHVKAHGHSNDTCVNEKEIKMQFADLSNVKARAKDEITENVTDYKLRTTKTNQTWSGETRQSKTEVKTMFDRSIAHEGASERSLEQHFEVIPTHVKPHGHSNDSCVNEKEIKVQFADLSNANTRAKDETTKNVTDYKLRPTKTNETWSGETRQSKTEVKTMFDRPIAHEGASERSLEQHFEIIPTHVKPNGHSNDTCADEKEIKVQFADLSNANARAKDETTENDTDYKLRPTKTNQTTSWETCQSKTEVGKMFDSPVAHESTSERSLEDFEIISTHVKPHGHSNDTCADEKEIIVQFVDLNNAKPRAKDETTCEEMELEQVAPSAIDSLQVQSDCPTSIATVETPNPAEYAIGSDNPASISTSDVTGSEFYGSIQIEEPTTTEQYSSSDSSDEDENSFDSFDVYLRFKRKGGNSNTSFKAEQGHEALKWRYLFKNKARFDTFSNKLKIKMAAMIDYNGDANAFIETKQPVKAGAFITYVRDLINDGITDLKVEEIHMDTEGAQQVLQVITVTSADFASQNALAFFDKGDGLTKVWIVAPDSLFAESVDVFRKTVSSVVSSNKTAGNA